MTCWRNESGSTFVEMTARGHSPCASGSAYADVVLPCCDEGSLCMSNNICHFPNRTRPFTSGYYIASCTDKKLQDPGCLGYCNDHWESDVVYDPAISRWQCCGVDSDGKVDCDHPDGKIFNAPAPDALKEFSVPTSLGPPQRSLSSTSSLSSSTAVQSNTTSSNSASIPISLPSVTQGASSTSHPSPSPAVVQASSGLSTGAKAGVSVGTIVGFGSIALLSALLYLSSRKRRNPQPALIENQKVNHSDNPQPENLAPQELYPDSDHRHEMPGQRWDSELDPSRTFHEIPRGSMADRRGGQGMMEVNELESAHVSPATWPASLI